LEIYDTLATQSDLLTDVSVRLIQNSRGGIVTTVEHPPPR